MPIVALGMVAMVETGSMEGDEALDVGDKARGGRRTSRNQVQEEGGSQAKMKSHLCLWRKAPPPFPTYKCRQVQSSTFAVIVLHIHHI